MKQETLYQEAFVFVAGRDHPLGDPDRAISWDDLRQCRWIWPLHGSPAYATLVATLGAHGIGTGAGGIESSSLALNVALIRQGDFVSILPMSVARQHVITGGMRVLPLPPLEPLGEVVAYWPAAASTPAVQLFTECLVEVSRDLPGAV